MLDRHDASKIPHYGEKPEFSRKNKLHDTYGSISIIAFSPVF